MDSIAECVRTGFSRTPPRPAAKGAPVAYTRRRTGSRPFRRPQRVGPIVANSVLRRAADSPSSAGALAGKVNRARRRISGRVHLAGKVDRADVRVTGASRGRGHSFRSAPLAGGIPAEAIPELGFPAVRWVPGRTVRSGALGGAARADDTGRLVRSRRAFDWRGTSRRAVDLGRTEAASIRPGWFLCLIVRPDHLQQPCGWDGPVPLVGLAPSSGHRRHDHRDRGMDLSYACGWGVDSQTTSQFRLGAREPAAVAALRKPARASISSTIKG